MRLPRFTIAGLMGLVVVVAVAVAALRFASELWAGILLMLTLGVLGASILAFHDRSGSLRSWWRGFALFGWGYIVLAMGPWASDAVAPHLPTTMGLDALYAKMHLEGTPQQANLAVGSWMTSTATALPPGGSSTIPVLSSGTTATFNPTTGVATPTPIRVWFVAASATPEFFRRVGHCLWALLVACAGGVVGRACHAGGANWAREGGVGLPR
jgi:hypothetical protein